MTRATHFAAYSGIVTLAYAFAWFKVLTIPLVSEETVDQLLPVVRPYSASSFRTVPLEFSLIFILLLSLGSLVVTGMRRVVLARFVRDGLVHVQRYTRSI